MKKSLIFSAALLACAFGFQSCDKVSTEDNPTMDPVEYDAKTLSLAEFAEKYGAEGVLVVPEGVTTLNVTENIDLSTIKIENAAPLTLAAAKNVEITVSEAVALNNVTITGDEKAPAKIVAKAGFTTSSSLAFKNVKIEAAEATAPLVQMDALPAEGLNEAGAFEVEAITFDGVTVNGLNNQLIYGNKQKYLIKNLDIINSTINIAGAVKKTVIDFNGGGMPLNVNIKNSTIAADEATQWQNGGFFSTQSGAKLTDVTTDADAKHIFTIENSKLTNIAKAKTLCTLRQNNQAWQFYVVKDNEIANCGKSGQFLKGLVAGQNVNKKENWTASGNKVTFDGADVGADENKNSGLEGACIVPETPAAE